ncbi:hypothetical protein HAX54_004088 [Datura stramonium]|uniref:RNA helicase n=1 Tax=Datura stramonium TaxID=4076 RepID=A0ABS8T6F2_DATST|nr:hypothetical protein [Datura stramonium]
MSLYPLQFLTYSSHYRNLKPFSITPLSLAMKDRPLSSCGAVYVPPHQRLRSLITVPSAASPQPGGLRPTAIDQKPNPNTLKSYPYLPLHQCQQQIQQQPMQLQHQHKRSSQFDEVSEEGSACDIELTPYQGAAASDNAEAWKWKLTALLHNNDKQELLSREKKDRRDYEQIAALARKMGLYSNLYSKVVVVSKLPLPSYRFDLDDKRPQREVILPPGLPSRVDIFLGEYMSHKPRSTDVLSRSSSNGSIATDEGLFEQSEALPQSKTSMKKILWQRSMQMQTEQQTWQESPEGRKMLEFRSSLPAYKEKDTMLSAISQNQVVIISGETGCGKTTQIPQFILESEIESVRGDTCSIICTQPRRISVMAVSERVAAERGELLGETVGYKVRLEGVKGRDTHLLFCTTGILLRRLLVDRNLKGITHVIVDEIHERGINEDFLLIVLKDLLPRRPELRLILMSATLDAELFSSYFDGAPLVHIPVRKLVASCVFN